MCGCTAVSAVHPHTCVYILAAMRTDTAQFVDMDASVTELLTTLADVYSCNNIATLSYQLCTGMHNYIKEIYSINSIVYSMHIMHVMCMQHDPNYCQQFDTSQIWNEATLLLNFAC